MFIYSGLRLRTHWSAAIVYRSDHLQVVDSNGQARNAPKTLQLHDQAITGALQGPSTFFIYHAMTPLTSRGKHSLGCRNLRGPARLAPAPCPRVHLASKTPVSLSSLPTSRRHFTVIAKPLVRGRRWCLRLGSPLAWATCMLIWCFFSVNRVPSQ